jgi:ribosomal protein S18 acetylase RimI-like enzyme
MGASVAGVEGDPGLGSWCSDLDVLRAQWAVHQRAGLACRAATAAGVPGRFRVWEQSGVYAVLATDPTLAFLSTVTGATAQSVTQVLDLVCDPVWAGIGPAVTLLAGHASAVGEQLQSAGLVAGPERALAVQRIDTSSPSAAVPDAGVVDASDVRTFVEVLLAGYEVGGAVADYISAEHRDPAVLRFLAVDAGSAVGAAAMTVHGGIAVLGGASIAPSHRGRGLQSRLIDHRVRAAAEAGCKVAVATVRPDSPSASNLHRAGFRIHRCSTWCRPRPDAGGRHGADQSS